MRRTTRPLTSLLVLLALATAARADVVHLKTGAKLEGTIESESERAVVLKLPNGRVTISRAQIASIEHVEAKPETADVPSASPAGVPTARDIVRLLRAEKFADAEKALREVRAVGRDPQSGQSQFFAVLEKLRAVHSLRPTFDTWCASSPRSSDAHLIRGTMLIHFAWEARGSGWASTVTPEGWKLFGERLEKARQELELAARLEPKDPYAPANLVVVGMALDLGPEKLDEYFEKAVKADPRCMPAYLNRIGALEPRWGGTNEAMFAFARKCVTDHPDEPIVATVIVTAHEDYASFTAGDSHTAPDKARAYLARADVKGEIEAIYDRIHARYPRSGWADLNRAHFVSRMGADTSERLKWVRRAAEAGDAYAQVELGRAYQSGDGVPRDPGEAAKWIARGAAQDDPAAQEALAYLYVAGLGVERDPARGFNLYRDSAELDHPHGVYGLGWCYRNGVGVKRDDAEGLRLLERATALNDNGAMLDLGLAYFNGEGVAVDKAKGRKLIEKAAACGNAKAQKTLATLPRE